MAVEPTQTATVSCPECGGNVRVLKQIKQSRSHRSRVIPSVLWLVLVLALVAIWLWNGAWSTRSWTIDTRVRVGSEFRTAFVPWEPEGAQEQVYLSSSDMQGAVEGDEHAMRSVIGTLQTIIDRVDTNHGVVGLLGVRFSLKDSEAILSERASYLFGGDWVLASQMQTIEDIRDVHSVKQREGEYWEELKWKFFPKLSFAKIASYTPNVSVLGVQVIVSYFTVLGMLSMCMLLAWFIRCIGCAMGIKVLQKRLATTSMVVIFFGFSLIAAYLNQHTTQRRTTISSQSTPLSSLHTMDELRSSAADSKNAIAWCKDILALLGAEHDQELLLGQYWVFDTTIPESTHQYSPKSVRIQVVDEFRFVDWGHTSYSDEIAQENLPSTTYSGFFRTLIDRGVVMVRWEGEREKSYVSINIVNIALVVVSLFWVWAGLHWASRWILGCVQRRRVRRDQCIFCAYPLTSEARIARNPSQAP